MAKILSNSGITTNDTIRAGHVTQSVDALTGTDAYDITISGSLTSTGNLINTGGYALFVRSSSIPNSVLNVRQEGSGSIAEFGGIEIADQEQIVFNLGGHITASGNVSSSAVSTASFGTYLGDGSQLTGITGGGSGIFTQTGSFYATTNDLQITGSLTVTSDISASGVLYGNSLNLEGANISYDSSNDILYFADSVKLGLGSGPAPAIPDISISHDGANGLIRNATGDLTIESSTSNTSIRNFAIGGNIILQSDKSPGGQGGVVLISGSNDDVRLDIRGNVTASGNISSSADVYGVTGSFLHLEGDGSQLTNLQRPISNSVSTNVTASNLNSGYYFRTGGNITCSIQSNAIVSCDVGSEFEFFQTSSAGNLLFHTGSGVTLNSKNGSTKLSNQFSAATLKKIDTNEWDLIGDLS